MLTLFSTCKPFHGHNGVIQRNALKSWSLLHPDIEIILFGDDAGVADISRELGIRHEPHTEKNEFGLKRLDYMFSRAQKISRHDLLCYINCDIILMTDFCRTLERANVAHSEFLMVGRRWDTDIFEPIDFSTPDWAAEIRRRAQTQNCQRDAWYIDYFCFSRGLFGPDMPPLVVGRVYWDNWTIWKALDSKKAVVDASRAILAIHQNHEYQYHPRGKEGVWSDEQAQRNFVLAGGFAHLRSIDSAQFRFTDMGIEHNPFHWYAHWSTTMDRRVRPARTFFRSRVWYPLLDLTRPVRHLVGLKRGKPIKRREQC